MTDIYAPAFEAARAVVRKRHQPDGDPLDAEDFDFLHEIVVAALAAELKRTEGDRTALDVAVAGLRELEDKWDDEVLEARVVGIDADPAVAEAIDAGRAAVSALLDKIGDAR